MSRSDADVPDVAPAKFVRWIAYREGKETIRGTLKHLMWTTAREHAVLALSGGRTAIVAGGFLGMTLDVADGKVVLMAEDRQYHVERLLWHTHPMVTGPSEADFALLRMLRQRSSVVYELGGDPDGTVFRVDLTEEKR